jgi:hypothetical protein
MFEDQLAKQKVFREFLSVIILSLYPLLQGGLDSESATRCRPQSRRPRVLGAPVSASSSWSRSSGSRGIRSSGKVGCLSDRPVWSPKI